MVIDSKRTVLFDLDGTLLSVDMDFFLEHYLREVARFFEGTIEGNRITEAILVSTEAMVKDTNPHLTNREVFARSFETMTGHQWDTVWPTFLQFYEERFPALKKHARPRDSGEIVEMCVERGWDLVLATNPLFPEIAVRERMRWCGVDRFPWRYITTLDNMHACKPSLEYYREIVRVLNLDPCSCVMVGNDVQEDMVAKRLGMKTFLVEDHVIDRGNGCEPDGRGTLWDVPGGIETLLPPFGSGG